MLRVDESEKFVAGLLVVAEGTEHGAGHRLAVLLFHTAHLHAEMAGLDDDANTLRNNFFFDGFGDLASHALLNLQTPRKHIDQACDLAETNHFV